MLQVNTNPIMFMPKIGYKKSTIPVYRPYDHDKHWRGNACDLVDPSTMRGSATGSHRRLVTKLNAFFSPSPSASYRPFHGGESYSYIGFRFYNASVYVQTACVSGEQKMVDYLKSPHRLRPRPWTLKLTIMPRWVGAHIVDGCFLIAVDISHVR